MKSATSLPLPNFVTFLSRYLKVRRHPPAQRREREAMLKSVPSSASYFFLSAADSQLAYFVRKGLAGNSHVSFNFCCRSFCRYALVG